MVDPIRVLLADDHPLMRAGIRSSLSAEEDILVVGEAAGGEEVRTLCQDQQPDVLLLDLNMPGPPAAQTVAYLRARLPNLQVLILTAYDDDAYVRGLISIGVAGYILKDETVETVARAVRAVMHGDAWFSRPVVEKLARWKDAESELKGEFSLTEREREILTLLAQGWDNLHIAEALHVAEQTVRNRISGIYDKVGLRSRAELIVWARELGVGGK